MRQRVEVLLQIHWILASLCLQARSSRHDMLAYLIEMARIEAKEELAKLGNYELDL